MEIINNAERLSDVMPVALSLACCGGSLVHHQQEWIAFRKVRFNVFLPMNVVVAQEIHQIREAEWTERRRKNLAVHSRRHVESH